VRFGALVAVAVSLVTNPRDERPVTVWGLIELDCRAVARARFVGVIAPSVVGDL
jgi:hypothetical protein